jgi:hypothetical protein
MEHFVATAGHISSKIRSPSGYQWFGRQRIPNEHSLQAHSIDLCGDTTRLDADIPLDFQRRRF